MQPGGLRALSGRNLLITRAYGSLSWRETLGQNGQIGRQGATLRLSHVTDQRHGLKWTRIVTSWHNWRRKRKRRRGLSTACFLNHGAGAFRNGPLTSVVLTLFGSPEIANRDTWKVITRPEVANFRPAGYGIETRRLSRAGACSCILAAVVQNVGLLQIQDLRTLRRRLDRCCRSC